MFKSLSDQVPIEGRWKAVLASAGYFGTFNPYYGVLERILHEMERKALWAAMYPEVAQYCSYGLALTTGLALPFALSKIMYPESGTDLISVKAGGTNKPKKDVAREIRLGDMVFMENDLFTNIMITGAIGAGKTSSAIYPILSQMLNLYSVEDSETQPDDPYQKLGGLVLDVKGDFYESLVYKMHQSGRDVLNDLVVITPHSDYPFGEFVDPETGYYWYLSARGGGEDSSNEMAALLSKHGLPDPNTGSPNPREPIPVDYLLDDAILRKRIGHNSDKTFLQYFQEIEFEVSKNIPKYIGWRLIGGVLRRAERTENKEVIFREVNGGYLEVAPPKKLKFERIRYLNNGLTFNICPPSLGPAELSNRLIGMSRSASGKGGSDNAFWDDATKKHIGWVVQMWREIHPEREITAVDINRLTGDQRSIDDEVDKLIEYIEQKTDAMNQLTGSERARLENELHILRDMKSYFENEWKQLDQKTKSNLVSCITNLFGQFMSDPKLRKVFCVPSSFKIDDILQSGKIFTLVAPGYESAARIFGTALKMEFQAIMRRRVAQSNYNKMRFILFMCDEAQNYVTAGGSDNTGDENFMALSRQSRVCNIIATQSDSSIINVIGEKSAPVYYQSFGSRIWYQNTDSRTNKSASEVCGKIKKEKVSKSGKDVSVYTLFQKEGGGMTQNISVDSSERFPPETFPNLNVHECVIYNKGRKGSKEKSCKNQLAPDPIGSKAEKIKKDEVIRWYFQAFIENRLAAMNESFLVDHDKSVKVLKTGDTTQTPTKKREEPDFVKLDDEINAGTKTRPGNQRRPVPETMDLGSDEDDDSSSDLLGMHKLKAKRHQNFKDRTREPLGGDLRRDVRPLADDTDEEDNHNEEQQAEQPTQDIDTGEPDISEEEINAIQEQFGSNIGQRLQQFVSVIDKSAPIEEFSDGGLEPSSYKNFDGEKLAGDGGGSFIKSANFEQERDKITEEQIESNLDMPDFNPEPSVDVPAIDEEELEQERSENLKGPPEEVKASDEDDEIRELLARFRKPTQP